MRHDQEETAMVIAVLLYVFLLIVMIGVFLTGFTLILTLVI